MSAPKENTTEKRIDALQQELMDVQLRYQREIERLERDNKELKKQILLNKHSRSKNKQIKVFPLIFPKLYSYNTLNILTLT